MILSLISYVYWDPLYSLIYRQKDIKIIYSEVARGPLSLILFIVETPLPAPGIQFSVNIIEMSLLQMSGQVLYISLQLKGIVA